MQQPLYFPADAHEGPVWVADQCRLYFTTKTHLDGVRRVDIQYLDFSALGSCQSDEMWKKLNEYTPREVAAQVFIHDARMANSMTLAPDGRSLMVAEQGDEKRKGGIANYRLTSKVRQIVVDEFEGKPFNSPNKVITTKRGDLIFSDPDYAFRQGFRPPPQLEPNLYILTIDGQLSSFRCGLEMPHGLALSPDESTLFVTDTSNDGAHGKDIKLKRRRSVWKFDFDPTSATISGKGSCCFAVDAGVPDGMAVAEDRLLVGGGDGVYIADLSGELLGKIPTPHTAVNVTLAANDQHLFVTAEKAVLLFPDWRAFVREKENLVSASN